MIEGNNIKATMLDDSIIKVEVNNLPNGIVETYYHVEEKLAAYAVEVINNYASKTTWMPQYKESEHPLFEIELEDIITIAATHYLTGAQIINLEGFVNIATYDGHYGDQEEVEVVYMSLIEGTNKVKKENLPSHYALNSKLKNYSRD